MSVLLDDFDAPRRRGIPPYTTVLLCSEPTYPHDKNDGDCYRNPACDCLHWISLLSSL